MAISKHVIRPVRLPITTGPTVQFHNILGHLIIMTTADMINCAWAFLTKDVSNNSKIERFIRTIAYLTEFNENDSLQNLRFKTIISSLRGPMYPVIMFRLIHLTVFQKLRETMINTEIADQFIRELQKHTRIDADILIAVSRLGKTNNGPARKRHRSE